MPESENYFVLYVSTLAYEKLLEKARFDGYVRVASGTRNKGFGMYLTALIDANPIVEGWQDTRPAHLQESTISDLEGGSFPTWDDGRRRHPRYLRYPAVQRQITCQLARHFGTIRDALYFPRHSFTRRASESSLISGFWEAVGLGWLTYTQLPAPPPWKQQQRRKQEEWDW